MYTFSIESLKCTLYFERLKLRLSFVLSREGGENSHKCE
jgi:hypothetical protein